ncbi:MAG: ABC transporter permease [Bacilli bacterium]|jgi:hypothetical protein|nr:ABC transporter permease [Bacilli bacterium]
MKKASIILSIVASVLVGVAFIVFFFVPQSTGYMAYGFQGSGLEYWAPSRLEFFKFSSFAKTYGQYPIMWAFFIGMVLIVILWVVHLVVMGLRHRGNSFFVGFAWLLAGALSLDVVIYGFLPGMWASANLTHEAWISQFEGGTVPAQYANIVAIVRGISGATPMTWIMDLLPYVLGAIALILLVVALILSFADMGKNPGAKRKKPLVPAADEAAEENPAPIASEEAEGEDEYRQTLNDELSEIPDKQTTVTGQSYQGPQPGIIQYINYGGKGVSKQNMNNGQYVTKDDLTSIIREELGDYEAKEAKAEEPADSATLTSDDLRQIIREEIGQAKPVDMAPAQDGMKASEIRQLIAEEIAKALAAERDADARNEQERETRREEREAAEKAAREGDENLREARVEELAAQLRASNDELAKTKSASLRPEEVRTIVAQELDRKFPNGALIAQAAPLAFVPSPAPSAAPPSAISPVVAPVAPVPAPSFVPVPETPKIIRIPFPTRLTEADKDLRANYNTLKAEALSYGLKSRVSNSGDTFRLHTKTYLKIAIAGKGLKLYLAIDPKDYANGPIPVKDASGKNIYKEIPGCFKVKSDLSLKRAKQLIAEACGKDKLVQGNVENRNYAAELKDYKPQGSDEDDD